MPKLEKQKVVYPKIDVKVFSTDFDKVDDIWDSTSGSITLQVAKDILGWEEDTNNKFGALFTLKTKSGVKVRLLNNLSNRPFYPALAEQWKNEILKGKWRGLNGETIILDKYGYVHDGQHRLVGLILAIEEYLENAENYPVWNDEPEIDGIVVVGIEPDDDTVNTIGVGKTRSLQDVFYRSRWLVKEPSLRRKRLAKHLAWAVKTLWQRTQQGLEVPKRTHSESLDFLSRHEKLVECVKFADAELQESWLSEYLPVGLVSALIYLQGSCESDDEVYIRENNESVLDWSKYDLACEFWTDLIANGKKTEALREEILSIPVEVAGVFGQLWRTALIVKAWNLFANKSKLTQSNVKIDIVKNEYGVDQLTERPVVGGIDLY